jgi:hypothetical protein
MRDLRHSLVFAIRMSQDQCAEGEVVQQELPGVIADRGLARCWLARPPASLLGPAEPIGCVRLRKPVDRRGDALGNRFACFRFNATYAATSETN